METITIQFGNGTAVKATHDNQLGKWYIELDTGERFPVREKDFTVWLAIQAGLNAG